MSLPTRPSVWLSHHRRKGPAVSDRRITILDPNFMRWLEEASGSLTLVNLSDVRIGLERVEKHGEEFTVLRGRSRVPGNEQDIGPFYLRVDEDHAIATIDRSPQIIGEQGEKVAAILNLLRTLGRFSVKDAIQKGCGLSLKPSEKTVRRAIRFALEHGFVIETEEGSLAWV